MDQTTQPLIKQFLSSAILTVALPGGTTLASSQAPSPKGPCSGQTSRTNPPRDYAERSDDTGRTTESSGLGGWACLGY
jgi:hypothetical protein